MAIAGPQLIRASNIGEGWLNLAQYVLLNHGEARNVVVVIDDPVSVDDALHGSIQAFCHEQGLLAPKHVAYTLFPQGLAQQRTASELFDAYNRTRGFFDRVKTGWGTYFRRMTHYEGGDGAVNQLSRIIDAINSRTLCHRAAYTMAIPVPGSENVRTRGAPCLGYVAVQVEATQPRRISLLAVYRNHDVVERVYGNFLGLGWLLRFLCDETGSQIGQLTCLSSHAYINGHVGALREFLRTLGHA